MECASPYLHTVVAVVVDPDVVPAVNDLGPPLSTGCIRVVLHVLGIELEDCKSQGLQAMPGGLVRGLPVRVTETILLAILDFPCTHGELEVMSKVRIAYDRGGDAGCCGQDRRR